MAKRRLEKVEGVWGIVDGGVNIESSCVLAREKIFCANIMVEMNRRLYSLKNGNNWPKVMSHYFSH